MSSEKDWTDSLRPQLQTALQPCQDGEWRVEVCTGWRLTYAHEILLYRKAGSGEHRSPGYATDLLVYDIRDNGDWIPRVVIECKLGSVTTHDALTYSTKAATHKHVHPYLRYGILVGAFDTGLPGRPIRHGAYFDFMMVLSAEQPSKKEWSELKRALAEEVAASRTLQSMLTESRSRERKRIRLLHRRLWLSPTAKYRGARPCTRFASVRAAGPTRTGPGSSTPRARLP
jgi:hypothetical protein